MVSTDLEVGNVGKCIDVASCSIATTVCCKLGGEQQVLQEVLYTDHTAESFVLLDDFNACIGGHDLQGMNGGMSGDIMAIIT